MEMGAGAPLSLRARLARDHNTSHIDAAHLGFRFAHAA